MWGIELKYFFNSISKAARQFSFNSLSSKSASAWWAYRPYRNSPRIKAHRSLPRCDEPLLVRSYIQYRRLQAVSYFSRSLGSRRSLKAVGSMIHLVFFSADLEDLLRDSNGTVLWWFLQVQSFSCIQAVIACLQEVYFKHISKVFERCVGIVTRSLFDTVKFRVQFFSDNAVLSHCFLHFRLGSLEPFPMCVAFPRSQYYDSSDFSEPSPSLFV